MKSDSAKKYIDSAISLLTARYLGKYSPMAVGFSLLNPCNSNCVYCDTGSYTKKQLKTEQILKIVDDLAKNGCKRISFTGGEPLLRRDIGIIIHHSKNRGLIVGLNSNGWLVKKRIDEIKEIDILTLSLDGTKKAHEKLRGKGSYQKVMESLQVAKSRKIKVTLTCVLTKYNLDEIAFLLDIAEKNKVVIYFQPVSLLPLGNKNYSQIAPSKDNFRLAIQSLINSKNKYIGNSLAGLRYLQKWPDNHFNECCAGKIYCAIDSEGRIYSCSNLRGKEKGISLINTNFKEAFGWLPRNACLNCWCSSQIEMNYIFSLNLNSIAKSINNQI